MLSVWPAGRNLKTEGVRRACAADVLFAVRREHQRVIQSKAQKYNLQAQKTASSQDRLHRGCMHRPCNHYADTMYSSNMQRGLMSTKAELPAGKNEVLENSKGCQCCEWLE